MYKSKSICISLCELWLCYCEWCGVTCDIIFLIVLNVIMWLFLWWLFWDWSVTLYSWRFWNVMFWWFCDERGLSWYIIVLKVLNIMFVIWYDFNLISCVFYTFNLYYNMYSKLSPSLFVFVRLGTVFTKS